MAPSDLEPTPSLTPPRSPPTPATSPPPAHCHPAGWCFQSFSHPLLAATPDLNHPLVGKQQPAQAGAIGLVGVRFAAEQDGDAAPEIVAAPKGSAAPRLSPAWLSTAADRRWGSDSVPWPAPTTAAVPRMGSPWRLASALQQRSSMITSATLSRQACRCRARAIRGPASAITTLLVMIPSRLRGRR